MDLKTKLDELVSEESEKMALESNRKRLFKEQQILAFGPVRIPLTEIVEAAGSVITYHHLGESHATIRFGQKGNIETTIEIDPNSVGRFSASPSPAPGFTVRSTTTYDYGFKHGLGYIEPTVREHVWPDSEALLNDIMKQLAAAIASTRKTAG